MPLTLPKLDDRTWKDLVEEALAIIPSVAPEWTDFNASDPGITLVELFAYLTETLLYQVDRVSDANRRSFLKLVSGPGWEPSEDLQNDVRKVVADLRRPHRAVTPEDFEILSMEVNRRGSGARVARAHCLGRRNLENAGAETDMPGHVSVVIVPDTGTQPAPDLIRQVRDVLEPARLITTRVHVVGPRFVNVGVRVVLSISKDAQPAAVQSEALKALRQFFDPRAGGPDGSGWPFGRSVYVSEVYRILARIPGVLFVSPAVDAATGKPLGELVVAPADQSRVIRNQRGELEAVLVRSGELVDPRLETSEIEVRYQN